MSKQTNVSFLVLHHISKCLLVTWLMETLNKGKRKCYKLPKMYLRSCWPLFIWKKNSHLNPITTYILKSLNVFWLFPKYVFWLLKWIIEGIIKMHVNSYPCVEKGVTKMSLGLKAFISKHVLLMSGTNVVLSVNYVIFITLVLYS